MESYLLGRLILGRRAVTPLREGAGASSIFAVSARRMRASS
jgi:hypothetical protein